MRRLILQAAAIAASILAPVEFATAQQARPATEARTAHISIVEMGSGPPVYLIPGLASPRAVWDEIAPELAKTHKILLVQVNGFGGDDPGANLKPGVTDGVIADVLADAKARNAGKPAVIGHSYGGLIAMMMAARHPDRIGRVMVVDALPFIGKIFDPASTPASIEPRAAQMRTMMAASYDRARAAPVVTADPGGIWSNNPDGRIRVANWSSKADARVVAQAMYEDMVTDIGPELGKVTARPFTILYAAGVGEARAKALWEPPFAGTPAKLVAVPDSYHFIMLDQPARFAAEVKAFLAE
ncbi:alpha/beta hydrolase [Sphingomonas koreensis]|uniref:alpha/beta fold hydrolase n=1 Tax=Sphingomonas koreensis TaxID=93064 RepID=UPI000831DFFF|nr:alpha/beta hydrolase [Sphingomonas koreensis]PJI88153.1 pimeloyl-ACP methyl ester carboxylesterase [Sphingomonas koreensis]RSU59397.1 alpha/beta hydrolase [Sphingomonas koreensis]RSU66689.1 alpha/beta hydrolase [Sphingomonas koreensis]